MTHSEFHTWLAYHRAKFTGLGRWFATVTADHKRNDDAPSLDDVMTSWYRTLKPSSLEHAKEATDKLGDHDTEPKGWDRHPMAIAGICRKLRGEGRGSSGEKKRRYVDGEEVYECLQCKDYGYVGVWHPNAMRAARDGEPVHATIIRTMSTFEWSVRCTCKAGVCLPSDIPVFNPKTMLPFKGMPFDRSKEPEDLLAFVVGRGAKHPEFAQHSGDF